MTDYNDGNWHFWTGGDCPVHPESVVDAVIQEEVLSAAWFAEGVRANRFSWVHGEFGHENGIANIIRFRVTKPYVEPPKPREVWVAFINGKPYTAWSTPEEAEEEKASADFAKQAPVTRIVHMREVTE